MSGHRWNGSCVCVSLWIEKAVEVRYVHDKRACLPQPHAVTREVAMTIQQNTATHQLVA